MTGIVDWAVANTRLVLSLIAVVVIAGAMSFIAIPKEADPDIPIPMIYVSVPYPGISPEDSERLLIKPMETYLRAIEGVKEISSVGQQGHASIFLEFDVNFDKEKALQDVRAQVDLARAELPQESEEPTVHEFNTSLFPVITVTLSGDVPERTLLRIAKQLEDDIESIPSVLQVDLAGQREELLEVVIDPAKLESHGLTQQELFTAVSMNNQLIAAGSLDTGRGRFAVKVPGLFESQADVLRLPLRANAEGVVTIGDVADIRRTFQDASSYARMNGRPGIALEVTKRIGENIIETNTRVRQAVAEAQKSWPAGVEAGFILDASDWINASLGSLVDAIVLAIVLVMIIVVASLGLRSGLIVGFAIPASFLISFFILNFAGMTLNMMIMFGMLLAVGILVDGAIIVVEYADRKMAEGTPPKSAFAEAARRMFWPVVSATAAMLAVFLPMLLWPGVSGRFMSYFPITLIIVLSASMVVALVFLPVIGGIFGRPEAHDEDHLKAIEASERGDWREIPGITGAYARLVARYVRYPGRIFAGGLSLAALVIAVFVMFNHGVEFFVDTEPEFANVYVSARGNLSAAEKRDLVIEVERIVTAMDGIESVYTSTGGGGVSFGGSAPAPDSIGSIFVEFKDHDVRRSSREILEDIRTKASQLAGIRIEAREAEQGPPTGKAIAIELGSEDYTALLAATAKVRAHLESMGDLRDVEDTRPLPGIEWALKIDREQAGKFAADVMTLGAAVQLVTNGVKIGEYRPDDSEDEIEIRVRYPADARSITALDNLRVTTRDGLIPISNFVTLAPQPQVNKINRLDGVRVYRVRADTAPDTLPSEKVEEIRKWIETEADLPPQVRVNFGGADEQQNESMAFLFGVALPMAIFLTFIVLLAMFNSFYHSILILLAVILAWIGSMLGMVLLGQPFSVIMTGTGMLALAGIVVNHNIVLIDTYQKLVQAGMEPIEAVIRSSAQRLRPVFLTTITAMMGLFPMMLALEINFFTREITIGAPAALWWVQLSTAIVFGLGFSKLITLGLMPAMLAWPATIKHRRAAAAGQGPAVRSGAIAARPPASQKRPAAQPAE